MIGKTHTIITARQIKAARALLDWSQDQLADACHLSIATIRKIETGHISPRSSTMSSIQDALENAGLEFINPNGVRQRPEEVIIYEGHDGIVSFFNEVYNYASSTPQAHIVQVCYSEDPFTEAMGEEDEIYRKNMESIKNRFRLDCILTENISNTCCSSYCEYRYLSKSFIDSVPFYIFGNNYAIIVFDKNHLPKITVIQSQSIADAFRRQFLSMWDKATPLNMTAEKIQTNLTPKKK